MVDQLRVVNGCGCINSTINPLCFLHVITNEINGTRYPLFLTLQSICNKYLLSQRLILGPFPGRPLLFPSHIQDQKKRDIQKKTAKKIRTAS